LLQEIYTKKKIMLRITDIENGRKPENKETYMLFCERYVPCVVGKIKFRTKCYEDNFSDYCSVSDEAMAFLVYANNYDGWVAKATTVASDEDKKPRQKYFDSGKGRGHTYNQDGRRYYNKIYDMIKNDRKEYGVAFDIAFLVHMSRTIASEGKDIRKGKRKRISMREPLVKCHVDDDDDNPVRARIRLDYEEVRNRQDV
jgi:hypothetical protein